MADSRAWFRLYSEFAFDPKVQLLDETLQRRFVMLLCLAGAGITPTDSVSEVDFALRIGVSECDRTRSILVSKGLIDEHWFPKSWSKRQFESDTSTPRVKRFRQRQKAVSSTVTETPSEQSRTEHIQSTPKRTSASATPTRRKASRETEPDWMLDFKLSYPDRAGDHGWRKAMKAANARMAEGHEPQEFIEGAKRYAAFCAATGKVGTEFVKHAATFLGPDKPFTEAWAIPGKPNGSNPYRGAI